MNPPVIREPIPGMGEGVARRTVYRENENWQQVAFRVALGNTSLAKDTSYDEFVYLRNAIASGRILLSGRHLQHGDVNQPTRNQEVFTNCATSANTFGLFYLLLNGAGVGRSYNDELMLVDWRNLPHIELAIAATHPDFNASCQTPQEALAKYHGHSDNLHYFTVPDSREGWAKAIELLETLAFTGDHRNDTVLLDFSEVRPKGSPIGGMQNRPSSGPIPLMASIAIMSQLRDSTDPVWKQTMIADHVLAACVAVGGARRAARMSVKHYTDPDIFDFISIKDKGGLWSSNNSVAVDKAFWELSKDPTTREAAILDAVCNSSYYMASGEPGLINVDSLTVNQNGFEEMLDGTYMGSSRYQLNPETIVYTKALAEAAYKMKYPMITNPCGEICLTALGGYCVIGSTVPYHAESPEQAIEDLCAVARALIRVNLMDSLYHKEVRRTNRIGVGFTGVFEFAWKFFGLTWHELIDETISKDFWAFIARARAQVERHAKNYAESLGVTAPHTVTTLMPTGTISKLYGLTEGGHLPAMGRFLRNVQFLADDPLVDDYEAKGYPVIRKIPDPAIGNGYNGSSLVKFPTEPIICTLDIPAEKFVVSSDATMEQQYRWLQLLEKYWLGEGNNQISYTLKYDKTKTDFESYINIVREQQSKVRCVSVLPISDWKATQRLYGYVPEEPVTKEEYDRLVRRVKKMEEYVSLDALQCENGACPL